MDLRRLKEIAKEQYQKTVSNELELIDFLGVWFSQKFKLPDNHPLFLDRTLEEWMVEYYKDQLANGREELVSEEENRDEWENYLKKEMGDDYREEDDYLTQPSPEDLRRAKIIQAGKKDRELEEFEENFPVLGEDIQSLDD